MSFLGPDSGQFPDNRQFVIRTSQRAEIWKLSQASVLRLYDGRPTGIGTAATDTDQSLIASAYPGKNEPALPSPKDEVILNEKHFRPVERGALP